MNGLRTVQPLVRLPSCDLRLVLLLCATLLLGGCAAGSPAVVGPTAPENVEAPQVAPPAAAAAAPEISEQAVEEALPATDTGAAGAAAFAQDVPAVDAPRPETAPAVTEPEDGVAAPAAQAALARPPAPPDSGTELSLIVEGGPNDRLEVALTFDAGADTGYAAQILDLLRDEGILATFGMTGQWAEANPDLVKRMVAEGHQLINHTWDHSSLTGANTGMQAQTPDQVAQQLQSTETVVWNLTGYEMRPYFRPPYGDYDAASLGYLSNNGYSLTIWWTCDSHGWAGWGAQEIVDYCTTNIRPHEILLLHVGNAAAGDFEALPGLIGFFRNAGYGFVTVEQMLQP